MVKRKVRKYTPEFKQQAVDLASRMGAGRAAQQLGIGVSNIHHWKAKREKPEARAKEALGMEEENRLLKRENEELKKVVYILKRAAAFFSQDQLK